MNALQSLVGWTTVFAVATGLIAVMWRRVEVVVAWFKPNRTQA